MANVLKRIWGLFLLLLGLTLAGWIAYNLLVEMQPEARGRDPFPAIIFAAALIAVGLWRLRGGPRA